MRPSDVLVPRPEGLYCPPGDFFIDPVRPVPRAAITHAHSDHARPGHGAVLATRETLEIMALRLGPDFAASRQPPPTGEILRLGSAEVAFHPAGHVLGSAQIAVEAGGLRVVAAGDYKRERDPTCEPLRPSPRTSSSRRPPSACPSSATHPPRGEIAKLLASLAQFPERTHVVGAYALGKAQRVISLLREAGYDAPIYLMGRSAACAITTRAQGIDLGRLEDATVDRRERERFAGAVVLAPPSAFAATWIRRFSDPLPIFASGWMQVRARARQRGVELPLILSDHCDWDDLTATLAELSPRRGLGHPRPRGGAGALVRAPRPPRAAPHLVGYEDESD
jgi:putative mRNA 3-end processing factor